MIPGNEYLFRRDILTRNEREENIVETNVSNLSNERLTESISINIWYPAMC